jgi:hypothetical protein
MEAQEHPALGKGTRRGEVYRRSEGHERTGPTPTTWQGNRSQQGAVRRGCRRGCRSEGTCTRRDLDAHTVTQLNRVSRVAAGASGQQRTSKNQNQTNCRCPPHSGRIGGTTPPVRVSSPGPAAGYHRFCHRFHSTGPSNKYSTRRVLVLDPAHGFILSGAQRTWRPQSLRQT